MNDIDSENKPDTKQLPVPASRATMLQVGVESEEVKALVRTPNISILRPVQP